MSGYLHGIDRDLLHKLYYLKEEAQENGNARVTIVAIINALLADALDSTHMDELRQRFCARREDAA